MIEPDDAPKQHRNKYSRKLSAIQSQIGEEIPRFNRDSLVFVANRAASVTATISSPGRGSLSGTSTLFVECRVGGGPLQPQRPYVDPLNTYICL